MQLNQAANTLNSSGGKLSAPYFWFPRSCVGTHSSLRILLKYALPRRAWERVEDDNP